MMARIAVSTARLNNVPCTAAVTLKKNLLGYKGVRPNPLELPLATGLKRVQPLLAKTGSTSKQAHTQTVGMAGG